MMTYNILGAAEMQERIARNGRRCGTAISREEFVDAITMWGQTRRLAEALSREELGAMAAFDRLDALRKGLILGLSIYYADNPRADVAIGVLAIVSVFSDNDKGECSISQTTMAMMLHRTRSAISEAASRLVKCGAITSGRGRSASMSLVIPRTLVAQYNHTVWLIEALKNVPSMGQLPDCPVKPTIQPKLSRQADNSAEIVPSSRHVGEAEIVPSSRHDFTKDLSLTLSLEESPYSLSDLQDRKPDCASAEESSQKVLLESLSGQAIAEAAAKAVKPTRSTKAAKNSRPEYAADFEGFWRAYPRTTTMSKKAAYEQWGHLDAEDREWAAKAAPAYRDQQARKAQRDGLSAEEIGHLTLHAVRFLKDRRFDAYREYVEGKQTAAPETEACIGGMPKTRVIDLVADFFRHGAARWTARISEALGAPPGAAGCSLPSELIEAGRALAGGRA